MRRVLCFVGFHHWEHHVNPENRGGQSGRYDLCSHCGQEKRASMLDNPSFTGPGGGDA